MVIRATTPPASRRLPPPRFTFGETVALEKARQDRISIKVHRWVIEGLPDAFTRFARLISNAEIDYYEPEGIANRCQVFNTKDEQHHGQPARKWTAFSGGRGGNNTEPSPLFRGYLKAKNIGGNRWEIFGHFTLNPTRYCAHSRVQRIVDGDGHRKPNMVRTVDFHRCDHERELVEDRNVIIGHGRFLSNFDLEHWSTHASTYLNEFYDYLHELIEQSVEGVSGMGMVSADTRITVKEVETYFEWNDASPLSRMNELEHRLRRLTAHTSISSVDLDPIFGDYNSSPCVTLYLRAGVALRIYAKTTRRIRFEVVHKLYKDRNTFDRKTCRDIAGLMAILQVAASEATVHVDRMLRLAQSTPFAQSWPASVYELIWAIIYELDNAVTAKHLSEQLAVNQRITAPRGTEYRTAINKLRKAKIIRFLEQRGSNFIYVPTDRFIYNTRDR